jgi:DinB family protein
MMHTNDRKKLINQYKDGYRVIAEALTGATEEELDHRPAPEKWSAREIVHHLADSEMTAAMRLRLLIATEQPQIVGFDQDEFARRLYYDRPIEAAVDAFKSARRTTAEILERLTEEQWAREGTHSEHGRYTVERWLEIYAKHAHNHAEQIRVARGEARKKKS